MISKEAALESVQRELELARGAFDQGNHGKVRVCARRAVGHAISWMLTCFPKPDWRTDAMSRIQSLSNDPSFANDVRNAARRLAQRVDEHFSYASDADPLSDARLIIQAIIKLMDSSDH